MRQISILTILLLTFLVFSDQAKSQVRLRPEEADRLVLDRPAPQYPHMARLLKQQDTVIVEATISASGAVVSAEVLTGEAVFRSAAVDAVIKRRYKPHVVNGQPTPFVTTVEVVFSLGIAKAEYDRDRKIGEQYFPQVDKCRSLVRSENWKEAERACTRAVEVAEMFRNGRELEKMGAYELSGHVMRGQKRYREALDYYSRARDVVRSKLDEKDAELGELYGVMAITHHLLRELDKARDLYRQAERVLQAAYVNMGGGDVDEETENIRRRYIKTLRTLLQYHLAAAEDAGATSEIEEIKKLMKSLP